MEDINMSLNWDIFHISCIIFYTVYGLLCMFLYRPYSRYIYFRGNWNDNHDKDKILEYYAFGAGECCIVMGVLTTFCYYSLNPILTYESPIEDISKYYIIFQILCWNMWLFTELYYTLTNVEWKYIGYLHCILCSIVLSQAFRCFITFYDYNTFNYIEKNTNFNYA